MRVDSIKLRRARNEKAWTQTELGLNAGCESVDAAVRMVRRGEADGALSADSIRRIAKALGKPVDFFIAGTTGRAAADARGRGRTDSLRDLYATVEADIDASPSDATIRVSHARALIERMDGDPRERVQRAIDLLDEAIELAAPMTEAWAVAQQLLAKAWFSHVNPEGVDQMSRARAAITEALRYWRKHSRSVPEKLVRARCLNDLAVILAQSPASADRREAARLFERVAEFRLNKLDDRNGWAVTMRNLGNCWGTLGRPGERLRRDSLDRAIAAYQKALMVHTLRTSPLEFAKVSYSLADALLAEAVLAPDPVERARLFVRAIRSLAAKTDGALSVLTRAEHPVDWANAQFNLAATYHARANPPVKDLTEAIHHYEQVLLVFTQDVSKTEYALTLLPLAAAKQALAALPKQNRPRLLRQAIAHVKAARQVFPADPVHRKTLDALRKLYTVARRPRDPIYSAIKPGLT